MLLIYALPGVVCGSTGPLQYACWRLLILIFFVGGGPRMGGCCELILISYLVLANLSGFLPPKKGQRRQLTSSIRSLYSYARPAPTRADIDPEIDTEPGRLNAMRINCAACACGLEEMAGGGSMLGGVDPSQGMSERSFHQSTDQVNQSF
jgi:hypothetical protein